MTKTQDIEGVANIKRGPYTPDGEHQHVTATVFIEADSLSDAEEIAETHAADAIAVAIGSNECRVSFNDIEADGRQVFAIPVSVWKDSRA